MNLIRKFGDTFNEVMVITATPDQDLYVYLRSIRPDILFFETVPDIESLEKKPRLIVFDDLMDESNSDSIINCWSKGRPTQSWFQLNKTIRLNSDYVVLLGIGEIGRAHV